MIEQNSLVTKPSFSIISKQNPEERPLPTKLDEEELIPKPTRGKGQRRKLTEEERQK